MSANNSQQSSSLSTCAPGFNPRGLLTGPGVRGPIGPMESLSRTTVAMAEGSYMSDNVFVTLCGDRISRPHGHCLPQGRMGATPYPTIQEVGEQSELSFK